MGIQEIELSRGTPVILYLQAPKEKVWGILVSLNPSGVVVRGLDLVVFDDWMRQEARGDEPAVGLATIFYPMARVLRMDRDESLGPLVSFSERFFRQVGRTVFETAGLERVREE